LEFLFQPHYLLLYPLQVVFIFFIKLQVKFERGMAAEIFTLICLPAASFIEVKVTLILEAGGGLGEVAAVARVYAAALLFLCFYLDKATLFHPFLN
jgi:hypothetical protein